MPVPQLSPARLPFQTPSGYTRPSHEKRSPQVGYVARPLVGINIAPSSSALSDEPAWIRIDDPGSL